jgi:hypothetical protein
MAGIWDRYTQVFKKKTGKGIKEAVAMAKSDALIKKLGYDSSWFIKREYVRINGKWTYPNKLPKDDMFGMYRRFTDSDPNKPQIKFKANDERGHFFVRTHYSLNDVKNGKISFQEIEDQLREKLKVDDAPFMGFAVWYRYKVQVPLTKFWID